MHRTNLPKVGDSVILAVPPAILEFLYLKVGASVALSVDAGRLIVEANAPPRYSLDELLAASNYSQLISAEEREWIDAPAVGLEPL